MTDRVTQLLGDILASPGKLAAVLAVQRAALASLPDGVRDQLLARPRRRLIGTNSSRFAAPDAATRPNLMRPPTTVGDPRDRGAVSMSQRSALPSATRDPKVP